MKTAHRMALPILFCITLMAQNVLANNSPTAWLQSFDKKLQPLVKNTKQNNAKILQILNQMMNFDALCRASLGNHWDARTEAEQKEFSQTLRALIEKNVVKRLGDTTGKNANAISYTGEKINGDNATVTTIVRDGQGPRAAEFEIVYKLAKKGNAWIVVDMDTDGVSLVSNYRSQFHSIITKEGFDKLMQKMKDKLAE
ncbi:MAG: ABC transporter substrate-binding protein [Proteobacteria bacterium]|nr:ABC transporter substrate-binding protein [Pseudomonadota bacterium]